ncbi:hypothetical protein LTR86_011110 [Recurvomyces mirabilis]|nr:hypothetical protein LTR86_011110 [Recurvomyces mirabilis]
MSRSKNVTVHSCARPSGSSTFTFEDQMMVNSVIQNGCLMPNKKKIIMTDENGIMVVIKASYAQRQTDGPSAPRIGNIGAPFRRQKSLHNLHNLV